MASSIGVSDWDLRKMFNELMIIERAESGELEVMILHSKEPAEPLANEPAGTKSQILGYFEKPLYDRVATAHRYLRPDGSIGLSGKPDPKSVEYKGQKYHLKLPRSS